jgi:hypothetical protein
MPIKEVKAGQFSHPSAEKGGSAMKTSDTNHPATTIGPINALDRSRRDPQRVKRKRPKEDRPDEPSKRRLSPDNDREVDAYI